MVKDENEGSKPGQQLIMSPEEDEDMNPESHDTEKGTGTAINAAEISD